MKKNTVILTNILIWVYVIVICYTHINGGNGELLLYSGIAVGLLLAINIAYIERNISLLEIIFILINLILTGLVSYLSLVFIQLDVR